jgi:hypothetical protein
VGGEVFWNLKKLEDPKINASEKVNAIFNAVTAPLSLVPVVGPIVDIVGAAAPYITDVMEGGKDPPPVPGDVNSRTNPIGGIANKVMRSTGFNWFFRGW